MKYAFLLITALILASCAGSKQVEFSSLTQDPCKNETTLKSAGEFVGETVENLTVYQQGDQVYASMEVRTYCNARINFDVEKAEGLIRLKLFNAGPQTGDCACIVNVTTSMKNIGEGNYNVQVTNRAGNMLLAQKSLTVTE